MAYKESIDYCGPGESFLTKYIPRKITGIDINHCCYMHDSNWRGDGIRYKAKDLHFKECIKFKFLIKANRKTGLTKAKIKLTGWLVANLYYASVRLGSLLHRNKH